MDAATSDGSASSSVVPSSSGATTPRSTVASAQTNDSEAAALAAEAAALQERLARAEAKERSCRAKAAVEDADAGPTPDADAPTMLVTEFEGYEEGPPDELQRMQVLNEDGELVDKPPLDEAEQKRPMAEHDAHLAGLAKTALAHRRKGRYKAAASSRLEALSYARNVHRARAQGLAHESVTPEAAVVVLADGLADVVHDGRTEAVP